MDLDSLSDDDSTELDYAGNSRIIRKRDEIEEEGIQLPDVDLLDLCEADLPNPISDATAFSLSLTLGVLSVRFGEIYKQLLDGESISVRILQQLKMFRRTLLDRLVNPSSYTEADRVEDRDGYRNHISLEYNIFCALLECISCIVLAPQMAELKTYKPNMFPTLLEKNLLLRDMLEKPFLSFRTADLFFSLKKLEQQWTTLKYDSNLNLYLDCLLARVSIIYRTPTTVKLVGNLENYQRQLENGYYVISTDMLQDCCWSFIPMYRKLCLYEKLTIVEVPRDYVLSKSKRNDIREIFIENALSMSNNALLEAFRSLYMTCSERPSERKKYMRGYKKDPLVEHIWNKIRGKAFLRQYLVELNKAPWVLAREEESLLKRCELDLLIMLMANSYISNLSGIEFRKDFVLLQIEFTPSHPLLSANRPILLQAFNHFGVYYKQRYYTHNNFATSLWHWYDIMRNAPFYKEYQHKIIELGDLYRVATT